METTNTNLLQDVEQEINLQPVSTGIRFANYLLDTIFFYIVVFVGVFGLLGIKVSQGENIDDNVLVQDSANAVLVQYVISYIAYFLYYTIFETLGKGRTPGKMITGSVAKTTNGETITWKDALVRSLVRLVPFEPLSAFGTPWHDKWTNTVVVKKTR